MKIEVHISDNKLQDLSQSANEEMKKIAKAYIEEVLDEASRIEESHRTSNTTPEITATIIQDAVDYARKYGIRKKKPRKHVFVQIVAFLSTVFTGGLFTIEGFTNTWHLVTFLLVLLIATVSTVFLVVKND